MVESRLYVVDRAPVCVVKVQCHPFSGDPIKYHSEECLDVIRIGLADCVCDRDLVAAEIEESLRHGEHRLRINHTREGTFERDGDISPEPHSMISSPHRDWFETLERLIN